MRQYIITGAGGHLGNTLARQLVDNGAAVRGLALPNEDVSMLSGARLSVVRGDVRDPAALERLFEGLDGPDVCCIHTAGIVSVKSRPDPRIYDVNVNGTAGVIEACRAHRVGKLVYVSSVHAIPELPLGEEIRETARFGETKLVGQYAASKAAATRLVLDAAKDGLNATVVHPSGIIGPYDYGRGHMTQLVMSYLNGSLRACVNGGYDFVDVRDVADGILAAAERGGRGECYILSNRYYDVKDILARLAQVTGLRRVKVVLPMWFAKGTAPIAELYYKIRHESPLFTPYSLYTLTSNSFFSCAKAVRELGYAPRAIDETLRDTVEFLRRERHVRIRLPRRAAHRPLTGV